MTGRLEVTWISGRYQHSLSSALWTLDDEPEIVGPGGAITTRLLFDSQLDMATNTSRAGVQALLTPVEKDDPLTAPIETNASCSIGVTVVNASGSTEEDQIPARCVSLHPLVLEDVRYLFVWQGPKQ